MKILTLIVHTDVQQKLSDRLRRMNQVGGYTFSHVEGHGIESEDEDFVSAHDEAVGYAPRVRIDLLLQDGDVERVLKTIIDGEPSIRGAGFYWVTLVEKGGQL